MTETNNTKKSFIKKISVFFNKINTDVFFLIIPQFITFIIFAVIFSKNEIYPFGEKSIAWCDLKQQGIPLLMNLHDVLNGEGSILYSFNNASGMNFWGVFLFFLSNPFSFLCVFFEKADIYKLVSLLTILKLCTASFTATLFFMKSNKRLSGAFACTLGVSYSLCAYGMMYYQNLMWLDMMYLYPLLALSIERVAMQKGYGLYTAILTLCVIFNFYLSYMIVIAILIVIGLYLLISKQSKAEKKKASFNFFKGSAIAAMISAVSWLPAFIQYGNSGRGEDIIETLKNSKWGTTHTTILLLILSSMIIVTGVFSLVKPNRKKVATFISFILFAIPIFIEPINKMWHTGSYMSFPGRYAFITIFTGLQLVALTLEEGKKKNVFHELSAKIPKPIKYALYVSLSICGLFTIYYLFNTVVIKTYEENADILSSFSRTLWGDQAQLDLVWKVATIFLIVYLISVALYKIKIFPKAIFSLFLMMVVICEGIFSINTYAISSTRRNVFNGYEEFLDLESRINDDSFYRIKTEKKYQDSNLLGALGYNSIGHYTSLTNNEYMNTSKALGYSSSWMELSTYGGTELSDAILGVKYNVIRKKINDSIYTNGTYSIVETFGALGLGVKYTGNDDVFSYDEYSRKDFQEKIFSSLFETDENLFINYTPNILSGCSIDKKDNKTIIKGKGTINYSINVHGKQTLYFDAFGEFSNNLRQGINKGFSVYVNGNKIADYPDGMYTGLMNLGTFTEQKVTVNVTVNKNNMSLLSFGVYGLKHDVLKNAIDNKESGFLNAKDNEVFGTVNAKKGEKLFIAVPYDKGFKITLNGEKVEAKKVFGDFYSIALVDGENTIEMKYTPPGFTAGVVICILGLVISIILYLSKKYISKITNSEGKYILQKIKLNDISGNMSFILFVALLAVVIFVIYVLPIIIKL